MKLALLQQGDIIQQFLLWLAAHLYAIRSGGAAREISACQRTRRAIKQFPLRRYSVLSGVTTVYVSVRSYFTRWMSINAGDSGPAGNMRLTAA